MSKMKNCYKLLCLILIIAGCKTSGEAPVNIEFINETILPHTSVANQGRTQGCWAFSMASFIESERMISKGDTIRLSAIYQLREKYLQHFEHHYYTNGKDKVRGGSLGHTFFNILEKSGALPLEAYNGLKNGEKRYDHSQLLKTLQGYAKKAVKTNNLPLYKKKAEELLDETIGKVPQTFIYKGVEYTPQSFYDSLGLNPTDYIQLTSFTHHPFNSWFALEVPDNWEQEKFYNIPIDKLENVVRTALENGFTAVWDGDISEKGFYKRDGVALYPSTAITQEERQKGFDKHKTTDDHMMHIIGYAHDTTGKYYYIIKNSWGKYGKYKGLLYMSEDYFRAKTVSVVINKYICNQ